MRRYGWPNEVASENLNELIRIENNSKTDLELESL